MSNLVTLTRIYTSMNHTNRHLILHAKSTGAWLRICGTTASDTVLSATEFRDFLCTCYNVSPLNTHSHCNGCGTEFGATHTLICSSGGLVIARHNKIRDKILYLSRQDFTSASVHAKPLINQGHTISNQEIRKGSDKEKEMRGDMMVQGL